MQTHAVLGAEAIAHAERDAAIRDDETTGTG